MNGKNLPMRYVSHVSLTEIQQQIIAWGTRWHSGLHVHIQNPQRQSWVVEKKRACTNYDISAQGKKKNRDKRSNGWILVDWI